jgi:Uma2 family endonuclease
MWCTVTISFDAHAKGDVMSAGTIPDLSRIRTEDDTPVDNLFSECQMHLLVESLKASWPGPGDGRPFLVAANVGVFMSPRRPPVVPDVFLSLDVEVDATRIFDDHRSYFVWEFGKVPELVIEIVSPTPGGEDTDKLRIYERMNIPYYAIFDPLGHLNEEELRLFALTRGAYERFDHGFMSLVGVGLTVWEGRVHGRPARWLRWTDRNGALIPTAEESTEAERERADRQRERAEAEKQRAEAEKHRAEAEKHRAESAEERARQLEERLARYAARLRDAGLNPNGE